MANNSYIDRFLATTTRPIVENDWTKFVGMKTGVNHPACAGCGSERLVTTLIGYADEADKHVNHYECECGNLISIVTYPPQVPA